MPVFEIEINGKVQEVEAPDMKTAASAAQQYHVSQHPWNRFNAAARSGRMPVEGQNYPDNGPGSSYMPTKTENAKELAMLSAMIAAGPLAQAAAPAYPILAPAAARTGVAMAPDILTGDVESGLKKGAATAGMETLFSALGLPGKFWSAYKAKGVPQPSVHQAANFQKPVTIYGPTGLPVSSVTPPITFNRVNPGAGPAPTVHGGGPTTVTPSQVVVQPPSTGSPITGGSSPAAILQEPMTKAAGGFEAGQGARTAADVYAGENPDPTLGALAIILDKVKGLNPFRSENPASGAGRY